MSSIRVFLEKNAADAEEFLKEMIRIPSIGGEEKEAVIQEFVAEKLAQFASVEMVEIPESIRNDPEYTQGVRRFDYSKKKNVVARFPFSGKHGRSLIINSHTDVVGAPNWDKAFEPEKIGDEIFGRGACDAKGQITVMYLVFAALRDMGVRLKGNLIGEAVVEEEVGGNGSLALIRQGYVADSAIVMEPTELKIMPANRGAIWYRIEIEGNSVHMGKIWEGVNAIEKCCTLIGCLKEYEKRLIEESRNYPLFERYKQPVQVNFGTISGDGWPSMVCGKVVLEGGIGFLPNKTLATIKKEVEDAIKNCKDPWLVSHYKLSFDKLHNEAYEIPRNHEIVKILEASSRDAGVEPDVTGFTASCDARLFNKTGGMDTVVFGPGSLADAHSNFEKINMNHIIDASEILVRTILAWCGKE